ncbi:unnamed protein product [Bursaphelenchus xylophilus]|nr:unnamed protein product [Bursaphelenchus xylophilus]CAG9126052.1 unnamed protein product [Bursaphelenchus xylophilus]
MLQVLPFLLLTHNINKNNCIGPCFDSACPMKMQCINGECCDDPFNVTLPNIVATEATSIRSSLEYSISGLIATTTVSTRPLITCGDTSTSCRAMVHLCLNAVYEVMMEKHCKRTCNKCSLRPRLPKLHSRHCRDLGSNCARLQPLCHTSSYAGILRQYCTKTCRYCS